MSCCSLHQLHLVELWLMRTSIFNTVTLPDSSFFQHHKLTWLFSSNIWSVNEKATVTNLVGFFFSCMISGHKHVPFWLIGKGKEDMKRPVQNWGMSGWPQPADGLPVSCRFCLEPSPGWRHCCSLQQLASLCDVCRVNRLRGGCCLCSPAREMSSPVELAGHLGREGRKCSPGRTFLRIHKKTH